MKILINPDNKPELRRQKAYLQHYLALVDLALAEHSVASPSGDPSFSPSEPMQYVIELIDKMPDNFTTSDIYKNTDFLDINRGVVRAALYQVAATGKIKEVIRGSGRRPTSYLKNPPLT
jgi:hypothetical protein